MNGISLREGPGCRIQIAGPLRFAMKEGWATGPESMLSSAIRWNRRGHSYHPRRAYGDRTGYRRNRSDRAGIAGGSRGSVPQSRAGEILKIDGCRRLDML